MCNIAYTCSLSCGNEVEFCTFIIFVVVSVQCFDESLLHLETEGVVVMSEDHSMVEVPPSSVDTVKFLSGVLTPSLITAFLVCSWLLDCLTSEMMVSSIASAVQNYNLLLIKEGDYNVLQQNEMVCRTLYIVCVNTLGLLPFYESLSKETIKNVVISMINLKVLSQNKEYVWLHSLLFCFRDCKQCLFLVC